MKKLILPAVIVCAAVAVMLATHGTPSRRTEPAFPALDSTLVKIETDTGFTGWGESCPFGPIYLPAHALGVRAGIAELARAGGQWRRHCHAQRHASPI